MQKRSRIMIAAGGTGGHLFPAMQLAELLQNRGSEVIFVGHKLKENSYFQRNVFPFYDIPAASPRKFSFVLFLLLGTYKSIKLLLKHKPDVIVGFGSYHTVPILLASVLLRKKIVLYEANRVMGKVNRLFSLFVSKIAVQFPLLKPVSTQVQVPLFPWIVKQNQAMTPAEARKLLCLDPELPTLLIFGGSQGASFFNARVSEMIPLEWQVIHLAGNEAAALSLKNKYSRSIVKAFESNMSLVYAAADVAICRSGAGTIAELIHFQVPSLLIPYPYAADNHQQKNAEYLAEKGGAFVLSQEKVNRDAVIQFLKTADFDAMRLALRSYKEQNQTVTTLDDLVLHG